MRTLNTIAREIQKDWKRINPYAAPYLKAMRESMHLTDPVGTEDAATQVRYFLSNATTWRGPVARKIKAELNMMLEGKEPPTPPTMPKTLFAPLITPLEDLMMGDAEVECPTCGCTRLMEMDACGPFTCESCGQALRCDVMGGLL